MKRYSDYKLSKFQWLGEIPKHWVITKNRYGFKKSNNGNNESDLTPVLSLTTKGVKVKKNLDFGKSSESYIGHQLVEKGDIVFTPRDFDQTPILSDVSNYNGCISNLYIVDKTKENVLNHYVNYYWYGLKYSVNYFKNFSHGMRFSFNRFQFDEIPLLIPPFQEQLQIVQFLDEKIELVDRLISTKERKIILLKEQKSSIINELVTKGLNPNVKMKDSGVEWIGEIPEHWIVSKVMYTLNFHNNIRIPLSSEEREKKQGEYRYYGSTGIIDYIDDFLFDGEYILIGEDGSNLKLRTYKLSNVVSGKFWVNNHSHILTTINGSNHYFSHLLELTDFTIYITGSTQPKITMENLKIVPIIIPPIKEQLQIVEHLNSKTKEIDELVDLEQKKIDLLKEYRQSLISEVVTGKIKVTTNE